MKIDKNTLLWIIIGFLALLVLYSVFFQGGSTSQDALSASQAAAQQAASGYGGMVGGC